MRIYFSSWRCYFYPPLTTVFTDVCTNPLTIRSPKKVFSPDTDPLFYQVPCGHCKQCNHAKQSSWALRCYYEWLDTKNKGGVSVYITCTYAPDSLPYCDIPTPDGDYLTLPCFNKGDIQHFIDALRKYCQRNFDCNVRYLITSEYGGKKHRPHYHGMLHFSKNLYISFIKNLVRKYWPYGFVSFGKEGGIVKDSRASRYVTKYITKDFEFEKFLSQAQFDKLHIDWETFKSYRRILFPFHLQSIEYGYSLVKYNDFNMLFDGKCLAMDKDNQPTVVTLPLYHVRKLFYEVDKVTKSYKPTELGIKMLLNKQKLNYNDNIERLSASIETYKNLVQEVFNDDDISYIANASNLGRSRLHLLTALNDIQRVGIDTFYHYLSDVRYYMRPTYGQMQLSSSERLKLRYDSEHVENARYGKYADLRTYTYKDFANVLRHTPSWSHHLEKYAVLYDVIRAYIGYLVSLDYEKEQEDEQNNKLLIQYDYN